MMAYRPDIDGLRAIAVIAVILFHLDIDLFKGGFVGVDIFFVLSGYLITSILLKDLRAGRFSLADFYERRARRILPALVTVCTATLWLYGFALFPDDFMELGKSIAAAALSVSNIFFWSIINYFAATIDKPLLHTWSLGVEEQFYVIFPLLLMALMRIRSSQGQFFVLSALMIVSLLYSVVAVYKTPSFAFYMLPSRFWELGIGALLAFRPTTTLSSKYLERAHIIALGALLACIIFYDESMKFPGLAALIPCVATALLILTNNTSTKTQNFLSRSAAVFIGKVSYSLYLWHWPLIGLVRVFSHAPSSYLNKALVISLTFALAYCTWRFIETPFRNRQFLSRRNVFVLSALALSALVIGGMVISLNKGFPQRFSEHALSLAAITDDANKFNFTACLSPSKENQSRCTIGAKNVKPTVLLWGDSHAGAVLPAVSALLYNHKQSGIVLSRQSCPGFMGPVWMKGSSFKECQTFNHKVLTYLKQHPSIKYVIFSARWSPVAEKMRFNDQKSYNSFYNAYASTAQSLRDIGIEPLFIGPTPEFVYNVPPCLARQEAFGTFLFACKPTSRSTFDEAQRITLPAFQKLSRHYSVALPHKILCTDQHCPPALDGIPFYFDDDHLSVAGAHALIPLLEKQFGHHFRH